MGHAVKPYYDDGQTTIYHADNREVIPSIGETFDITFTSPPYNMAGSPWPRLGHWKPGDSAGGKSKWRNGSDGGGGVAYETHDDAMPWPAYVAWQHEVLRSLWEVTTGAIFYNHKPRVIGGKLWLPLELNPDLPIRQIITWARGGGMNFNPTAYVPTYEWIIVFAREAFRLTSKGASGIGDVWREAAVESPHPAPFPLGLPARAIETTGPGTVLDPCAGSGTTLRAAKDAGVHAVGIEKSERYCEMAVKRLAQGSLFGATT